MKGDRINRRSFVKRAAMASAIPVAAQASRLRAEQRLKRIGAQLYTVRGPMAQDLPGTLSQVAGIGYREVEFAGYFGRSPNRIRSLLESNELDSPASHIGPESMGGDELQKAISFAAAIGNRFLILAWIPPQRRRGLEDYERLAEELNRAGESCRKSGLEMAYHNHDFEFQAFDGQLPYDLLLRRTDPELVKMELDIYWIAKAGFDAVDYLKGHPGRFPLFHVKDMAASPQREFAEVGRGTIDFGPIFASAIRNGGRHFFVEQDETPGPPLDSLRISYEHLAKFEF